MVVLATLLIAGCGKPKAEAKAPVLGWRFIESWSGRGDTQTDSFDVESGAFRIKWETSHETSPGEGTFQIEVHSGISSRPIALAVERQGIGHDIAYVRDDPRPYYLVVSSKNVDWSIRVEEAVAGQPY